MTSSPLMPQDFVFLHDAIPGMMWNARYAGHDNFTGSVVDGYKKSFVVISQAMVWPLKKAQDLFRNHGYELVIYDAYRPQRAVDFFWQWALTSDSHEDPKNHYYPYHPKNTLFDQGYIAKTSAHTRGTAVDLTLIKTGATLRPLNPTKRTMKNGLSYLYLEDGTLDMGTHFDLFDETSHTASPSVSQEYLQKRQFLKENMESCGFINYHREWWHFQLVDEPFPSTYFNFHID